jgi:hypothetical protein
MVKILQEEKSFTRTYDERPVIMTGPLATVLAVQQQLLDRMATYVFFQEGREGGVRVFVRFNLTALSFFLLRLFRILHF